MNLDLQTIGQVTKDGVLYNAQRADVTDNPRFWAAFNYAKKLRANAEKLRATTPKPDLTSTVHLSREIVNGRLRWFATRILPVDSRLPAGTFALSFRLRDPGGLFPYQLPAVTHLCNAIVNHGAACDGSDTGIGKTYHALGVCRNLVLKPAIVCRKAGIASWVRACRLMHVQSVFITNWEQAKAKSFPYVSRQEIASARGVGRIYRYTWKLPPGSLLVFDECHVASVAGTLNNRLWLASRGQASLSLSATFSDRPERMLSLLWLLGAVTSKDDYYQWLESRGHFLNRYDEFEAVDATPDMIEINRLLYPRYGFRISYGDPAVRAFFPTAVYQTEVLSLGSRETDQQNALYAETIERVEHYRALGKQAEAMVADLRYRQATELLKAAAVAEIAQNYMDQGLSVVIFVNFRETLAWFAKAFKTKSLLFGGQEKYDTDRGAYREAVIEAFQANKVRIIIAMNQAGGQSISLHDLAGGHSRISLIFPTYDPIILKQVLGRTYRAGAKTTPVMKLVYAAGTIEEKVSECVNRKLDNIAALNEGDLMEPDLFNLGIDRKEVDSR